MFVYLAVVVLDGQLLRSIKTGVLVGDKSSVRALCGRTCVYNNCLATEVFI